MHTRITEDEVTDEALLEAIATVETIDDSADTIELTPAQIRAAILLADRAAVEARRDVRAV